MDLPGLWEQIESSEPGTLTYRESEGEGVLKVTLLAVRPVYAIADSRRLLDDYCSHRSKYEQAQFPTLQQSEPFSSTQPDAVEGGWDAIDLETGRRVRHKVVLRANILGDFRYEAPGSDEAVFAGAADVALGSVTVGAG